MAIVSGERNNLAPARALAIFLTQILQASRLPLQLFSSCIAAFCVVQD
jgi:antitoxin component of RelBE/YafQ-DinJ toxin-antitoxin module